MGRSVGFSIQCSSVDSSLRSWYHPDDNADILLATLTGWHSTKGMLALQACLVSFTESVIRQRDKKIQKQWKNLCKVFAMAEIGTMYWTSTRALVAFG